MKDFWKEHPNAKKATCEGCGKTILWALAAEGRRIPLDPAAPVYQVLIGPEGMEPRCVLSQEKYFVSHWSTCSKANERPWSHKPVTLVAEGASYEFKELLKEYGFRWDGALKIWHRKTADQEVDLICKEIAEHTEGAVSCVTKT